MDLGAKICLQSTGLMETTNGGARFRGNLARMLISFCLYGPSAGYRNAAQARNHSTSSLEPGNIFCSTLYIYDRNLAAAPDISHHSKALFVSPKRRGERARDRGGGGRGIKGINFPLRGSNCKTLLSKWPSLWTHSPLPPLLLLFTPFLRACQLPTS